MYVYMYCPPAQKRFYRIELRRTAYPYHHCKQPAPIWHFNRKQDHFQW